MRVLSCEVAVMEWYDEDYDQKYALDNRMLNGLSFEKGEFGDRVLKSYFTMRDRETGDRIGVSCEVSYPLAKFPARNIKEITEFLAGVADSCRTDPHLLFDDGILKKEPLDRVERRQERFADDTKTVARYYDGWQYARTIDMDSDAMRNQLASVIYYQERVMGVSDDKDGKDRKFLNAVYAKEYMECEQAVDELTKENRYELADRAKNGWTNSKIYDFESFMEGSCDIYLDIARKCRKEGMKRVYDIGSNAAFQAKLFSLNGMRYTGIEETFAGIDEAPKGKDYDYIRRTYSFPVFVPEREKDTTVAVSNLCVGFLTNPADGTYEQMAKDFRFFCGHPGPDGFGTLQKKFGITGKKNKHGFVCWCDRERVNQSDKDFLQKFSDEMNWLFNIKTSVFLEGCAERDGDTVRKDVPAGKDGKIKDNGVVLER